MLLVKPGSDVGQTVPIERTFQFRYKKFLDGEGGPDCGSSPEAASMRMDTVILVARLARREANERGSLPQAGTACYRTGAGASGRHHHSRRGWGPDAIAVQLRFFARRFSQKDRCDEAVALRMPLRWEPLHAIQKARGRGAPVLREAPMRRERRKDEVVPL